MDPSITALLRIRFVRFQHSCTGCKLCLEACPYSGPVNVPVTGKKVSNIKVICDLCNGHPACVEVCPTGTLQFVTIDDAMAERQKEGQERLTKLLTSLGLIKKEVLRDD